MAKKLDTKHQRKHNKRIFLKRRRKAKNGIKTRTNLRGNCNGTRNYKSVPTPISNNRVSSMHLQKSNTDNRPPNL